MKTKQARDAPIEAIVTAIVPKGGHGPYAIAKADSKPELGSITFALDKKVWREKDWPDVADHVVLRDIRKRPAGWRAHRAYFERP